MEIQQQNKLEPIQEESEQEDEVRGIKTGDSEEYPEMLQTQVGVDTEEVMAEEEEDDDEEEEEALLRVLRPRRLSRSSSQKSFVQMQPTNNHQEEKQDFSGDFSDEATTPEWPKLRIKFSKIRWPKATPPKPSVESTKTKSIKKSSLDEKPFPQWLVDLMINIEEATTHQLVVE